MIKKITLTACILMSGVGITFAQNLKDEWVKVPYLQLPRHPFAEGVKTYSSNILIPDGLAADQDRNAITASLTDAAAIPGYEKVSDEQGVVTEISLGWFSVPNYPEVITQKVKEKRGDKEVEVEYFSYRIQYRYPMRMRVLQGGQVIEEVYVRNSNDFAYADTKAFPSKSALYEFWTNTGNKFKSDVRDNELTANRNAIKAHIIDKYGYVKTEMRHEILFVKEKKDANEYGKLLKAYEAISNATPLKAEGDIYPAESYVKAVEEAKKLWKEELQESDPANRKARIDKKVTEAILKNMVISCYFTYQFEEAEEYLKKLEEMKEGFWAKTMRDKMADVKSRLSSYEQLYARK